MNAINAASFIADGLTAMNRAASAPLAAYASGSIIETMELTVYRLRSHAKHTAPDIDKSSLTEWADDLQTAINEAKGLRP